MRYIGILILLFAVAGALTGCPNQSVNVPGFVFDQLSSGFGVGIDEAADGSLLVAISAGNRDEFGAISVTRGGNLVWSNLIPGFEHIYLFDPSRPATISPSGSSFVVGVSETEQKGFSSTKRLRIVHFADNGGELWDNIYFPQEATTVRSIAGVGSDVVIAGTASGSSGTMFEPLVAKIGSGGAILWRTQFEAEANSFRPFGLVETTDSHVLTAGSISGRAGETRLVSIDEADGSIDWDRIHSLETTRPVHSLAATADGGAVLLTTLANRPQIVRFNSAGDLLWARSDAIGPDASSEEFEPSDIAVAPNGNIAVVGIGRTLDYILQTIPVIREEAFILVLDSDGDFLWMRTFPQHVTEFYAVTALADSGFATAGKVEPPNTGEPTANVIVFDDNGNVVN